MTKSLRVLNSRQVNVIHPNKTTEITFVTFLLSRKNKNNLFLMGTVNSEFKGALCEVYSVRGVKIQYIEVSNLTE